MFTTTYSSILVWCCMVGLKHATVPETEYNPMYTRVLTEYELESHQLITGGIMINPNRIMREISRTITLLGIDRKPLADTKIFVANKASLKISQAPTDPNTPWDLTKERKNWVSLIEKTNFCRNLAVNH